MSEIIEIMSKKLKEKLLRQMQISVFLILFLKIMEYF